MTQNTKTEDARTRDTNESFVYVKHDGVYVSHSPRTNTTRLPAGVYAWGNNQSLSGLVELKVQRDETIRLPDSGTETVVREFQAFWAARERYAQLGVVHKRGIILEGPPGSGKTTIVAQVIDDIVLQHDGLVISIRDVDYVRPALEIIRRVEKDRPILVVIEDFEDALARGSESAFLNVLDGREQVQHVMFVVTTNHIDKLPPRITNRPSRFDLILNIGMPTDRARYVYLRERVPDISDEMRDEIVSVTKGWSVAHLKELMLLVRVYGQSIQMAAKRINALVSKGSIPEEAALPTEWVAWPAGTVLAKGRVGDILSMSIRDDFAAHGPAVGEAPEARQEEADDGE